MRSTSRRAHRRQSTAWLLSAALVGTLLAGCGDTTSAKATSATGSAAKPTTQTVTIGKAVDTIGFTTVDVAMQEGYFAKQGIKVKEELLGGSSTAFSALESGGVQFVCASSSALLAAGAKGLPLQAITSLDYGASLELLVSKTWMAAHHMTVGEPLATTMKALEGGKFALLSSTDLDYDHLLAQAANISPSKYSYINIDSQSSALAGIQHGELDAFLLSPPSGLYAQSKGIGEVVATLHQIPATRTEMYDLLITDTKWASTHTTVATKVATAMAEADNLMRTDPQAVLSIEQHHYPTMPTSVLLASLKYVTFTPNGMQSASAWATAKKVTEQTGKASVSSVDVSTPGGLWTNKYIDQGKLGS